MNVKSFNVIQLLWEGPLSYEQIQAMSHSDDLDYGVYTIYGTHPVFGPNALLYVGQANSATFAGRLSGHEEEWLRFEATPVIFYLGRVAGISRRLEDKEWGKCIDAAEKIIIYECSPPYNSKGLKSYTIEPLAPTQEVEGSDAMPTKEEINTIEDTIVFNLGSRHRLPQYCSTLSSRMSDLPEAYDRRRFAD